MSGAIGFARSDAAPLQYPRADAFSPRSSGRACSGAGPHRNTRPLAAGGTGRQSDDIPVVSCDSGRRLRVAGHGHATARAENDQAFKDFRAQAKREYDL